MIVAMKEAPAGNRGLRNTAEPLLSVCNSRGGNAQGEDPQTVAAAVAAILDASLPELPAPLAEVVRLQSATRRIREADLPAEEQGRLLQHLGPRIKQAAVPELALRAVLRELDDPEAPPLPPPRWEQDQRRLRRENYETCPCCQSPIATEEELKAYERRRTQARDEAEVRKNALPLAGIQR